LPALSAAVTFDVPTFAGMIGVVLILGAYFCNQQRWLSTEDWRFPLANLIGSCLIMVSLYFDWNLPSVFIEFFWAAISLWGLVRGRFRRDRARSPL
jgi:hypothetical protein